MRNSPPHDANRHKKLTRPATALCAAAGFALALATATVTTTSVAAAATAADKSSAETSLQSVLAGSWRSDDNRARDKYRHPLETLNFFKVGATDVVIEITPGGGWYAEILAPLLKPHGHYIAAVMAPASVAEEQRAYQQKNRDKLRDKFSADPEHFGAAKIIEFDAQQPVLGAASSADVVLTFRNVHNWVQAGTEKAFFTGFFNVLKPGGVLGVEDHRAIPDEPLNTASGYLPEEFVIKLATDAGFILDGKSRVNANPRDTKDYPQGVWTLPPSLRLGDVDRNKYLAIGESDRFTLRFVKPKK